MSGHGDSLQEKMTVVSFAWLSVAVKGGATTLVPRKIVKVGWESNFGELLGKVDQELEKNVAFKMSISKNEEFWTLFMQWKSQLLYHFVTHLAASLFTFIVMLPLVLQQ